MLVSAYSPPAAPLVDSGDMAAIWDAAVGTTVVALMRGAPEVAAPVVRFGVGLLMAIDWPIAVAAGVGVAVGHFAAQMAPAPNQEHAPSPGVISTEKPAPDGGVPGAIAAPEDQPLHAWAQPTASAADRTPEAPPEKPPAEATPANDTEADEEAAAEAEIERVRHAPPLFSMPPAANQNTAKVDVSKPFDAYVYPPGEPVPTTRELLMHADLEFPDPLVRDAVAERRNAPTRPGHVPLSETERGDSTRTGQARRIHEALNEIDARAQQETREGKLPLYHELRVELGKYLFQLEELD